MMSPNILLFHILNTAVHIMQKMQNNAVTVKKIILSFHRVLGYSEPEKVVFIKCLYLYIRGQL